MKKYKLKIDIFDEEIYIFYWTIEQFNKMQEDIECEWMTFEYKERFSIYINSETEDKTRVLSHELIHLLFRIMNKKGIWLNFGTEEVWRYTRDYIFSETKKRLAI